MMPELDGYGLCRAVKQDPELDFIPVILLTDANLATAQQPFPRPVVSPDWLANTVDQSCLMLMTDHPNRAAVSVMRSSAAKVPATLS